MNWKGFGKLGRGLREVLYLYLAAVSKEYHDQKPEAPKFIVRCLLNHSV
jgi:hypothetical protein